MARKHEAFSVYILILLLVWNSARRVGSVQTTILLVQGIALLFDHVYIVCGKASSIFVYEAHTSNNKVIV